MDLTLFSIDYRDPIWIAIAFGLGLLCKQASLPPMLGYLVAGFVLNAMGIRGDVFLHAVADLGVTLLLFTIGLKLRLGTLLRTEIWATASLHTMGTLVVAVVFLLTLGSVGVLLFSDLDVTTALIVAFALSFSSTVFAVKTLEDRGSMASRYGQIAIGILVIQDILAVIFLAASAGKMPSPWALGLFALIPVRHLFCFLLTESGHRELLAIFGFVMALGGWALFEAVGMKGDLGALIFGVLLASHVRSSELAKTLLSFKDAFLVCFFLTIGLTGLPTWETALTALVLLILIPFKAGMFFFLLTRFKVRARAAGIGALILGNYSEFGLIVTAVAISTNWLPSEWLTVLALVLSLSFLISAPLTMYADELFERFNETLKSYERTNRLPGDEDLSLFGNRILIFGMGRVGRAAYDEMVEQFEGQVLGVDMDEAAVERSVAEERHVVLGDATHPEFWTRIDNKNNQIEMILLAMPNHVANKAAAYQLRARGYQGPIVATALFADQAEELKASGIDEVFNVYAEAGAGAASDMRALLEKS